MPLQTDVDAFYSAVLAECPYTSRRRLAYYLEYLFKGVDFADRRVLDIGGGDGLLSFYSAAKGAREVVYLEPEVEGSSMGVREKFERVAERLGEHGKVLLCQSTFQQFDDEEGGFGVVILYNAINHLDEFACANLVDDSDCRVIYQRIMAKLASSTDQSEVRVPAPSRAAIAASGIHACLGLYRGKFATVELVLTSSPSIDEVAKCACW